MKKKIKGVTLLEALLVMAIGAAIIVMSIQQYLSYKRDTDVFELKANVNAIFQAMASFYRVNCYGTTNPDGTITPGDLNPLSKNFYNPFVMTISKYLVTPGYLTRQLPKANPLVNSGGGEWGYYAQFNESTAVRYQCPTCTDKAIYPPLGTIIIWKSQVGVKLRDAKTAKAYLAILGGDCLSKSVGYEVLPCSANSTGDVVVWERLPTSANIETLSPYWLTNPDVALFKQMYTTAGRYQLVNGVNKTQYYLCGN